MSAFVNMRNLPTCQCQLHCQPPRHAVLCCVPCAVCRVPPPPRSAFVELEGVELMHLLLKGKKSSRYGAIKAIDFATTR